MIFDEVLTDAVLANCRLAVADMSYGTAA